MNNNQYQLIEQAINIAQLKGCYTLQESAILFQLLNELKEEIKSE